MMKYRVRVDLSFSAEADARAVFDGAMASFGKAVNINGGTDREETSFCGLEICRHEEGGACQRLERAEVTTP